MATGRDAITFNSAALSTATKYRHGLKNASKVTNYRATGKPIGFGNIFIGGDIVNNIQQKFGMNLPGKTIEIPMGPIPTHGIDKFLEHKLPER